MKLEDIKRGLQLSGIIPGNVVIVVASDPIGVDAFEVVYKTPDGKLGERTLLRSEESSIGIATENRNWDLSAPASLFKLALEAFRMRVAYLFDPMMAVHTSNVEPLLAKARFNDIYEEIVQRFTEQLGTNVTIHIEITAEKHDGFSDATIRTVSENSRTLKFKNSEFEG